MQPRATQRNRAGDDGAAALGVALKIRPTPRCRRGARAVRHQCSVSDDGTAALGEALKTNAALQTLVLCGSGVGDNGAAALGEALKTNAALQVLDQDCNSVGADGAAALGARRGAEDQRRAPGARAELQQRGRRRRRGARRGAEDQIRPTQRRAAERRTLAAAVSQAGGGDRADAALRSITAQPVLAEALGATRGPAGGGADEGGVPRRQRARAARTVAVNCTATAWATTAPRRLVRL